MDALIISILHTYKSSLLSLKAKWFWWGPSFFMQINYWYYFFLVFRIAWIHLFPILHPRICWDSIAENSLLCMVSRQAKHYERAFNFFLLPFRFCLCDTSHRLCLFCNILPDLKYKKIKHARTHPKLKEPVADLVWRQHFLQSFLNKLKNLFSFNNITDLQNIQMKLFPPCLNISLCFTLGLECFFKLNFPVFITDCTMGNITVLTVYKLHLFQMKLNWRYAPGMHPKDSTPYGSSSLLTRLELSQVTPSIQILGPHHKLLALQTWCLCVVLIANTQIILEFTFDQPSHLKTV